MNFTQKLTAIWQNINIVQRAMLIAAVLAIAVIGAGVAYWAQLPDMKVLYSGLAPEEAGKITDKVSERNIPYKLNNSGTTVYVPKEHVTQLRLDMAKDGLPGSSQKGYGIFDNEKVGVSPFVQNVNLKRALQDELAKSIQMIEGVTHARLHIVSPEGTLFNSEKSQTSASVVLRLKPGYKLSPLNIAAITHIVTGSVEGLEGQNVTVVDSQGRLLSSKSDQMTAGGAETVADYRERVEQSLSNKVEDMLVAVLGPGRAMVRVSADIDMTSSNVAKEIYDNSTKIKTREEISSISDKKGGAADAGNKDEKKEETIKNEFLVPKTVQQTTELAGEIKSLTVAAFVDLSPVEYIPLDDSDEEKKKAEAAASASPIMEIAELEEIIKRAVGPKLAADGLKVANVKFNRTNELLPEVEEAGGLDFIQIARQASLGIMAVCALLALKIFSGGKKKAAADGPGLEQLAALSGGGVPATGMMTGSGEAESVMLRRQIASSLQNNPEQAKQLFANWLQEKGN
ncbi:MAG: flagellar basal-body MS-ring/collar protein FliF [Planctomycetota bacterium]|jgi:flagellar M-ring protein FliF